MKALVLSLAVTAILTGQAAAASENEATQLDRIEKNVDTVIKNQEKANQDLLHEPLEHKKFGIEINPFYVLAFDDARTLSGTFSIFDTDNQREFAFPIYYGESQSGEPDLTSVSIDAHYRKFLGQTTNGMYISGFGRITRLSGEIDDSGIPAVDDTETKLGVGVGIGYRKFSSSGWYWGTSLSVGRYITGEHDRFANGESAFRDDGEYIVDVELMKFGFAF